MPSLAELARKNEEPSERANQREIESMPADAAPAHAAAPAPADPIAPVRMPAQAPALVMPVVHHVPAQSNAIAALDRVIMFVVLAIAVLLAVKFVR